MISIARSKWVVPRKDSCGRSRRSNLGNACRRFDMHACTLSIHALAYIYMHVCIRTWGDTVIFTRRRKRRNETMRYIHGGLHNIKLNLMMTNALGDRGHWSHQPGHLSAVTARMPARVSGAIARSAQTTWIGPEQNALCVCWDG
jgi:hypothetical protein